ncbi:MAG TPA: SigE family RNA polymerase sigma factor [Mycobacteriales bacterium]|nr:SigE family RNA polymerase sigma factor [Mycobacteriales bacterium]
MGVQPLAGPEGFAAFVAARSGALLRTAVLLTADRHAVEDALQEALVRVASRWDRVVAGGDPEPYVRRALYTSAVDGHRRRRDVPTASLPDAPARADDADRRVVLQQALARLTPRQRAVLVLRFYEDRTEVQAADLLGCSVSTVKSQTRHALERLRVLAPELVGAFAPQPVEVDR